MFVGHLAFAFLLPAFGFSGSFPAFLLFCQLSDVLFFTLVLCGVEHMRIVPGFTATNDFDLYFMPFSHSLLGAVVLSIVVFLLTRKVGFALATLSHFFGDLPFHVPDLTIAGGVVKYGFGLWNQKWVALASETVFFLLCVTVLLSSRAMANRGNERKAVLHTTWICIILLFVNFAQIVPVHSVRELSVSALLSYFAVPAIAFFLTNKSSSKKQ